MRKYFPIEEAVSQTVYDFATAPLSEFPYIWEIFFFMSATQNGAARRQFGAPCRFHMPVTFNNLFVVGGKDFCGHILILHL